MARPRAAALLPIVATWLWADPCAADWVVFWSGGAMEIARLENQGDAVRLTRADGGWVMAPVDRIDWAASSDRSGHEVSPTHLVESDVPIVGGTDGTADAAGQARSADGARPARRTRAGMRYPDPDPDSYRAFAVRVAKVPKVDGVLDDEAWQHALPFGGLYQEERHEGEMESEPTEVRIVYDDQALYFAIRAWDREPQKIVARNMLREATLRTDDSIRILIDPLHDHRTAYLFGTNPNGILVDAYLFGRTEANMNRDWNGLWWTRGSIDPDGWVAEVAVPFRTFKFPKGDVHTWGLTISRRVARRNEFS